MGCGEGWLARALAAHDVDVVGMDASAPLVDAARAAGGGEFRVLGYDALIADPSLAGDGYDAVICNFSLLDEHPAPLLMALGGRLNPGGSIVIQTVHPWTAAGDEPYADGWRMETFASMGGAFAEPMPWYFRTTESWVRVIAAAGCVLAELREPVHPDTGRPASLLLICYKTVRPSLPPCS